MPDMDGWNTLSRMKDIGDLNNIPMAIITSSSDPKDMQKAREMGVADYIKKPCQKDELLQRVAKILKK